MPRTKKQSADKRRKLDKERRAAKRKNILAGKTDKSSLKNKKVITKKQEKNMPTEIYEDSEYLGKCRQEESELHEKPDNIEKEKGLKTNRRKNIKAKPDRNESLKDQNTQYKARQRSQEEFRKKERQYDKQRKAAKKRNIDHVEDSTSQISKRLNTGTKAEQAFKLEIKNGPDTVCTCCLRLWFSSSCKKLNVEKLELKNGKEFCDKLVNDSGSNVCCKSCMENIFYKGQIPKFCAINYQIVFPVPNELKDLTVLEERMVAARIPFMQIRQVGYARQCSIRGQVVNVPLNVDTTVKILPRNPNEIQTIQVKLKRRMAHVNPYIFETVRPAVVLNALKFLVQQPLYVQEGIHISDELEEFVNTQVNIELEDIGAVVDLENFGLSKRQWREIISGVQRLHVEETITETDLPNMELGQDNQNAEDEYNYEDPEPVNPGGQETLLDNSVLDNISYAPGENQQPIHLMLDLYADELSFPKIFCGNKKNFYVDYSYAEETKVQVQHKDRRFARTDYLLYMFKKKQLILVIKEAKLCLRQKKDESGKYTAGDILKPNILDQLVAKDAGFMFLADIVNSPPYWKREKNKLMAMIRQFNIPTIFFTVSAAEVVWPELIIILSRVVDGKELSELEASSLEYAEKTRLIRSDPITCARYFDHRFKCLFKYMRSNEGPFKEHPIIHYYYRVEFQHRGSPHVHGLLWLDHAPLYNGSVESALACAKFADKYITCDSELKSIQDIIKFNIHTHNRSCKRELRDKKIVCRYNYPQMPMDETTVLSPMDTDDKELKKVARQQLSLISKYLADKPNVPFDQFLKHFNFTKVQYLNVLQQGLTKTTIFMKRKPNDCFVNNFNEDIFSLMRSNMDMQFVLEPYACCMYIVNYINKSLRGVSELMMKTMDEISRGNMDLKAKLKAIGGAFLNASEVSAQEAAYSLLSLHMHETSTGSVYINTKPAKERVRMVKSKEELKQLAPDDTDIYSHGLLQHYVQRPDQLENVCLAEFAAFYMFHSNVRDTQKELRLRDDSGFVVRRNRPNIISYKRYGLQIDSVNFYREQLMLYVPWRNEAKELENVDQQAEYALHHELIATNRQQFDVLDSKILDDALAQAELHENNIADALFNQRELDEEYQAYGIDLPDHDPFNILDTENDGEVHVQRFPTPHQISDEKYDELIRKLNEKQYEFLNYVLDSIVEHQAVHCIVSGPAGAGKSHLILAISQTIIRHLNSVPGNNPESLKVLLAAPTGKAAFGIGGITLHSAFSLPVGGNYNDELIPLNQDTVNTLYCTLIDLQLIIIDEYSMVGAKMFDSINQRLQQIFKCNLPFGGRSIILTGDLRQLPPVGDKWIFCSHRQNPYKEICGTYLWDKFKYFELIEIMRQREDKQFAVALNNMASGSMTLADKNLIKNREVSFNDNIPDKAIHLFRSNKEVDSYNDQRLSMFKTERAESEAIDIIKGSCSEALRQKYLKETKILKHSKTFGLMLKLILQINAKYMVSLNINTPDGLVNGATGHLRKIEYDQNNSAKRVWIEFLDEKSGEETRKEHKNYMKANNIPNTWTPIEKHSRAVQIWKNSEVRVERKQFPLLISEGITIHKSQGATYEEVAVHIGARMPRNAVYVACSRATKLNGLYIFGEFKAPNEPTEKDLAFKELQDLKENKVLSTKYSKQYNVGNNGKTILIYQNVQSLKKHQQFISNNPIFKNADMLIFVETWLTKTDKVTIDNFDCFVNLSYDKRVHKPFGIIGFAKKNISAKIQVGPTYTRLSDGNTFQCVTFYYRDILIIVVYIPPKLSVREAKEFLDEIIGNHKRILVLGDFNQDLKTGCGNSIQQSLLLKGLFQKLSEGLSTTKANTHIDWVFSDLNNIKSNTYTTVYSHHKAISISIFNHDIEYNILSQSQQPVVNRNVNFIVSYEKNIPENVCNSDDDILSIANVEEDVPIITNKQPCPLKNNDMVSCYANSIIQCLFGLDEFRSSVSKDDTDLNRALNLIMTKRSDNCLAVRRLVGEQFTRLEQQDAQEFLSALIQKLDYNDFCSYLKAFIYENVSFCMSCLNVNMGGLIDTSIFTLCFPSLQEPSIDFNDMFGFRDTDTNCERCSATLETKSVLDHVNKYLILHVNRTGFENGQVVRINTTFSNFNPERVVINDITFAVKSIIKHYGNSIQSGHYVSIVRYDNFWWKCNDAVISKETSFDNTLKDVYLIVLEQQ